MSMIFPKAHDTEALISCVNPSLLDSSQSDVLPKHPSTTSNEMQPLANGLESVSIRRIQGIRYGVLEFLGVGTTFDIFQNIHMAQIRRIFLDGYGVLVVRIVIFKISLFKLQNVRLLLIFTKYSNL
ncbi:hypothetical protein Tco_0528057 [Tanacetum coccineum]